MLDLRQHVNYIFTIRHITIALCLLFCLSASAVSPSEKTLLLKPTHAQVDSILHALDEAIDNKLVYQQRRITHADSMVNEAFRKNGQKRIEALKDAFFYYSHVSGRRSMDILNKIESLPEYPNDKNLQLWVLDSRGYIYSVMGMFHRSYALLHEIKSVEGYNKPTRIYHYETMCKILAWEGEAFCKGDALRTEEKEMMTMFSDSLLLYDQDTTSLAFAEITRHIAEKKYDDALAKLVELYPKTTGQEETYVYAHLCDVFAGRKDTLSLTYYFAKTSICDITAGTTEYMCLPILVQYLFQEGDVERAYSYLKCCIDDAYLYPSQYLISQTTNIFPIIDKAYQQQKEDIDKNKQHMTYLVFFAILLVFILIALSIFLHHRKLMMQELKEANYRLVSMNDDLTRANDIKSTFLRNMTHELHTPMNAIDGFAQILDADDSHADEASRKEMISAIRTSSHQLIMLIDNVIMLTEYEGTSVEKNTKKIKISKVFDTLSQIVYNSKAGKVDISFNNNVPDDFTFQSSEIHIVTILNNLIDSALKFTEEGYVAIKAELENRNKVVFRVSDTGNGIPADKKDTIFNRLSKADDFAQGIGLGLPLCHTLTRMLDGDICVEKTDSNGTTISVTFPC